MFHIHKPMTNEEMKSQGRAPQLMKQMSNKTCEQTSRQDRNTRKIYLGSRFQQNYLNVDSLRYEYLEVRVLHGDGLIGPSWAKTSVLEAAEDILGTLTTASRCPSPTIILQAGPRRSFMRAHVENDAGLRSGGRI